ncbi:hypothetical protein L4G92_08800 [Neisseria sp. ZJ106]|uniref:Lipoprotein n=1 Tax=Neisseria lisongii TaxID=2912188 RepID=A0ABY7RHA3_9NEIS|nr:hypothetical protein [Neisseria lisongii]MCF7522138.1 hypothetical protein [Neisseria lisongii]WCL70950.1 hypothetical protein PJU73_06190 [Neisseria lisongii]
MNHVMKMLAAACCALLLAACAALPAADAGRADYEKMLAWNAAHEPVVNALQGRLQQKMDAGNTAELEAEIKVFAATIKQMLADLDRLEIRNPLVAEFQAKSRESLVLSALLMGQGVAAILHPQQQENIVAQTLNQVNQMSSINQNVAELKKAALEMNRLAARLNKMYPKK